MSKYVVTGDCNTAINSSEDLLMFLLPKKLGTGTYRTVYEMIGINAERNVVKIAHQYERMDSFLGIRSNIVEYELYHAVKNDPRLADILEWLCPVVTISNCGRYLVMAQTTPVTEDQYVTIVDSIPHVLSADMHIKNFGVLINKDKNETPRIVMIDYGNVKFSDIYGHSVETKRCSW